MKHTPIAFLLFSMSLITLVSCEKLSGESPDDKDPVGKEPGIETTTNWMRTYIESRVGTANAKFGNSARPEIKIVGGELAGPSDNPFQVSLLNKAIGDNSMAHFCGGTLIAPKILITAAHCSDFASAKQVQVLSGARSLKSGGQRHDVEKIIVHPKWNNQTNDYDVAVWHLATPARGPYATLAIADGSVASLLLATGWGKLSEAGRSPTELYKVALPLADRGDCNDENSYNGSITDRMLCAGKAGGGVDTCQGDSGGPLTRNSELVGITSFGRGCAAQNFYGVYTRVSNAEIGSFIQNND